MIDPTVAGRQNALRALEELERQEWEARMDARVQAFIFQEMVAEGIGHFSPDSILRDLRESQ